VYRLVLGIFAVLLALAVPFALTGTEEDRRTTLGLVLAAGAVAGLFWLDHEYRVVPRRQAAEDQARRLGLRPAPDDGWVRSLPFDLLRPRGTVQDVENVLEGTWRGEWVVAFEYRWATEDREQRYSAAILPARPAWPRLLVKGETGLTRLARDAGLGDVETEWEAFNRAFEVRAGDPRFATALLDARMMEWLMALEPRYGFEVAEGRLLAYRAQVAPWEIEQVLETALAFRERIPPVVGSLFDPGRPEPPVRPDRER
jgi:hypothetical protein